MLHHGFESYFTPTARPSSFGADFPMYHELVFSNFLTMVYMLHTQVHVSPLSPLLSVYQSSFVLASCSNFCT